jgi:LacI family transcriptional regulator
LEGGLPPGDGIELIYKQTSGILPTLFPRLDSIQEDVFAAGVELTRLLLQRIEGAPVAGLQTLAEPVLHWRS